MESAKMNQRLSAAICALSMAVMAGAGADAEAASLKKRSSKRTPSQAKSVATEKSGVNWAKVKEKTHFMYWSSLSGPGLTNGSFNQHVRDDGTKTQENFFHMLWTGYRINPKDSVGVLNRFNHDFGNNKSAAFAMLNPRLYWRHAGLLSTKRINMNSDIRLELPTTNASHNSGMVAGGQILQNWSLKLPNKRWYVGLQTGENIYQFNKASGDEPNFFLTLSPSASYTLNDHWALYAWGWFDSGITNNNGARDWNAMGGDYVRVGPMYSPNQYVQIYPCLQAYPWALSADKLTLGLELSASL